MSIGKLIDSMSRYIYICLITSSFFFTFRITTYLRICHEKYFDCGRYDCKLWLIVFIISMILQLINIPNHGGRKYW